MRAAFRIGLLGFGNVGSALARRLTEDEEAIARAAGRPIVLEGIAVARLDQRQAPRPLMGSEAMLDRPGLDAIVECIGGLEPAHTYIDRALRAGRQVITANKQVIASYGPELATRGPLRFEASVGSAIPVIEMLSETLAADTIASVVGILNGTTNSMLEAMAKGASYADALADAQRRGMAEADPSADVDGHDAAAKLAILTMLAFRRRVELTQIQRSGIRNLDRSALDGARRDGFALKLIGAASSDGTTLSADVRPRLIPRDAPLARVNGGLNAVEIQARYAGNLLFTGPGAGPDAAASAVVADLVRAARDAPASAGAIFASIANSPPAPIMPLPNERPYPAAS